MIDITVRALDLIFRRIPPEVVFNAVWVRQQAGELYDKRMFLRYAESCFAGYSKEEKELLYNELCDGCGGLSSQHSHEKLPFALGILVFFAQETLREKDRIPVCRFSVLDWWRDGTLLMGQDVPVCCYLAWRDLEKRRMRDDFGWPATIRTDHHGLNGILKDGIAENHRHLKGSTQLAELSWYALMNNPCDYDDSLVVLDDFLQPVFTRGHADNVWSTVERIQLAAMLRAALFLSLNEDSYPGEVHVLVERFYHRKLERGKGVADFVDKLKFVYGKPFIAPDGGASVLDYAITRKVYEGCKESQYRVLAGERALLYECFRAVFSGRFDAFDMGLFSLYLTLKISFRSELVQENREVGFHNFMLYQNRKSFSWSGTPYEWEAYRMAINGPLDTQNVVALESRFAPWATPEDDIRAVAQVDLATEFARIPDEEVALFAVRGYTPEDDADRLGKAPDFYVMHFIKDDDEPPLEPQRLGLRCRHEKLRHTVREQALALAEALCSSNYLCGRIRGIDACNMELNCRPEVFAQAYRFLSDFSSDDFPNGILLPRCEPSLSRTYHVGEDFYSIVDGVRAIDEAIAFLELQQGDRLGHALALGVDPALHCECKSNVAVMSLQNSLDNMVWLLFRAPELGVDIEPSMHTRIKERAEHVFRMVYGETLNAHGWIASLHDYYESMLLRADDPECYRTMHYVARMPFEDVYVNYSVRETDARLPSLRDNRTVARLYYLYHYDNLAKIRGLRTARVQTGPEEYALMRQVQDAMIREVENHGLIIECNPSSNVLIGTFKRYDRHPMFRFNHGALKWEEFERGGEHRLKICINTDDLGVFDTSLDFEYALVRRALENQLSDGDEKRFTAGEIDGYLCELRDMGKAAVFHAWNRDGFDLT